MPMNASTSGISFGSSSRKRCGRQPETMTAWPRWFASRNSTDSKIVSTLSSCAESMKEQVLTMTASACAASLVISTPPLSSKPSMISASTRFLAQPSEIKPTRSGRGLEFFLVTGKSNYANERRRSKLFRGGIGRDTFHGIRCDWRGVGGNGFIGQTQLCPQPEPGGVRRAFFRVKQEVDHGAVQRVVRRERNALVAFGAGSFGLIILVDFIRESFEIFVAVILADGEFVVSLREQPLHDGGHAFLRSFVDVNLRDGDGVFIERQIFRQRIRLVFDDRLVGGFFAKIFV